jgi:hypothetical protein
VLPAVPAANGSTTLNAMSDAVARSTDDVVGLALVW